MARRSDVGFHFAKGCQAPDLYSTAYGVSLLGLCGRLSWLDEQQKDAIIAYFAAHQSVDGLYRAINLTAPTVEFGQGWGYLHLLPHILIALDYLGVKPTFEFSYLDKIFETKDPETWLEEIFSYDHLSASNSFMNIQTALQYERDVLGSRKAAKLSSRLNTYVIKKILPGLLFKYQELNIFERSKRAKTIYHLLPNILYDSPPDFISNEIVDLNLSIQNNIGSFGVCTLSDACEDIDSIYNLAVLKQEKNSKDIERSLRAARNYIPLNQNRDGGFAFRRFTKFRYGGLDILSSGRNQSNMFSTWFRLLAYAFADEATDQKFDWKFSRVAGYQWHPKLSRRVL